MPPGLPGYILKMFYVLKLKRKADQSKLLKFRKTVLTRKQEGRAEKDTVEKIRRGEARCAQ